MLSVVLVAMVSKNMLADNVRPIFQLSQLFEFEKELYQMFIPSLGNDKQVFVSSLILSAFSACRL